MSDPISAEELQRRWARTLGPTADLERVDPGATQKPVEVGGTLSALATVSGTMTGSGTLGGGHSATLSQAGTLGAGGAAPSTASDPTPGYDLVGELGRGGMGVVYRARQRSLVRDIALKFIKPEAAAGGGRDRFVSEALVNGLLDHPNIVPVHELGATPQGEVYLAMKLVGGRSWKALLHPESDADRAAAAACDLDRHLAILGGVCNAIGFAHSRGIIHRDLKPENVMVGEFGEVLVMDWGIAVDIRDQPDADQRTQHKTTITAPSGTPSYMAPELAEGRGRDLGPWTDVYLLGAILHEVLTGAPPHRGASLMAVLLAAAASKPAVYPANVPAGLGAIATKAMARETAARYATIAEFQAALAEYVKHRESSKISDAARAKLSSLAGANAGDAVARSRLYGGYAEAVAGFRQALVLWSGNAAATSGESEAKLAYAGAAFAGGDLGLAEAQLDGLGDANGLRQRITGARAEAEARAKAATRNRRLLVGATVAIIAGLVVGTLLVNAQRSRAQVAEKEALTQRDSARTSQEAAEKASTLAKERLAASLRKRAQESLRQGDAALTVLSDLEALPLLDGDAAAAVRLRLAATAPALRLPELAIPLKSEFSTPFWHPGSGVVFAIRTGQLISSWRVDSGAQAMPVLAHPQALNSTALGHAATAFLADGNRMVAAGDAGLWFWDTATGRMVAMPIPPDVKQSNGTTDQVEFAVAPDRKRVLAWRRDKLRWFDSDGKPLSDVLTAPGHVVEAVIRDDGKVVTVQESVYPQPPRIWLTLLDGAQPAWEFSPKKDDTTTCFPYTSPDRTRLFLNLFGSGNTVMFDLRTLSVVGNPRPDLSMNDSIAWSPDSALLAVGNKNSVQLFQAKDFISAGYRLGEITLPGKVYDLAWHPDSFHLAVSCGSQFNSDGELGQVAVLETKTGRPVGPPIVGSGSLAWSPDGRRLAVLGGAMLRVYAAPTEPTLARTDVGKRDGMEGVSRWIGDGPALELFGETVRRFEPGKGLVGEAWKPFTAKSVWFKSFRGDIGVWIDDHRAMYLVDLAQRKQLGQRLALPDIIGAAELSPDRKLLAVSYQHRVRLIDLDKPDQPVADFTTGNLVDGLSWDTKGERLLIWGAAAKTLVCDRTGKELAALVQSESTAQAVWSPDCSRIATYCHDEHVRVWDAATGKQLAEVAHDGEDVAWSADGATVMVHGRLRVQRYTADGLRPIDQVVRPPAGEYFATASFNPRLPWVVATGEINGSVRLWDTRSGEPLIAAIPLRSDPRTLTWNPTGTHLLTDDLSWDLKLLAMPGELGDTTRLRRVAEIAGRRRVTGAPLPEVLDLAAVLAGYKELGVKVPVSE